MGEEQKKRLEQQLWNIANELRGKMDADEFRDYILGFIFYKYLSEKIEDYANDLLAEDGIKFTKLNCDSNAEHQEMCEAIKEDSIEQLGYFLKPNELFSAMAKKGNGDNDNFILEDLTQVLRHIEQSTMGHESEDDFEHLFEDLDLTSTKLGRTEEAKNTLISKVLYHLDNIDFELKNHDRDVLGDAYEYLIGQFASGAGKKAGEFYTPQEVSKILAKIVTTKKSKLKSVYDPTCGSGSLLLRVAKEVEDVSNFYGQELNRTTYNLARMNMIMHDVHYRKFDIKQEDTLEHPQHSDDRFEAIVANPPFSAKWSANPLHMNDDRFSQYGKLAPASKADFAFVQHMIHHLDDNGTMAIVLPHGVLFRGAAEGHIRKYLIEDRNYLDAVIGLPANIFYGTSIPTCILVFKKCREDSDNVLFIDASNHFEKAKNQNYLRSEDIDKIITTFRDRIVEDKYSYLATLKEIKENDYNLNIPRYVDTFEEEEPVDIDEVSKELKQLDIDMKSTDETILKFCDELGIATPF
jgi:type I restriction enzyme M protein